MVESYITRPTVFPMEAEEPWRIVENLCENITHLVENLQNKTLYKAMLHLNKVHHIAIISSDYQRSLHFYTHVLGMRVLAEHYREERLSYKTDLALGDDYVIELFSFPSPPSRLTHPEAAGLRHLAFEVDSIAETVHELDALGISHEEVRTDEYTGKRFLFFQDPDGLPIELYER